MTFAQVQGNTEVKRALTGMVDAVEGKGDFNGFPRFGNHAWPEMNHALLVMMKDEKVAPLLEALKSKDEEAPDLGLRAFVWSVETFY